MQINPNSLRIFNPKSEGGQHILPGSLGLHAIACSADETMIAAGGNEKRVCLILQNPCKPFEYILSFLKKLESHDLDFKKMFSEQTHSIGKIKSAFANHSGGRIFFGWITKSTPSGGWSFRTAEKSELQKNQINLSSIRDVFISMTPIPA